MNTVEIEKAISALIEMPFDGDEFPFAFLLASGNKTTTIKMLRKGVRNKSDRDGLPQTKKFHLKVCLGGEVTNSLGELKASTATTKAKVKFVLTTDGFGLEAEDLTRCAEDILLARETHFPAIIADLYEVKDGESKMPADLRAAHDRNDEVLERSYIGRRFCDDTERLEKLFELYSKMTTKVGVA